MIAFQSGKKTNSSSLQRIQISKGADEKEIKKAYRKLAVQHHPDSE